MMTWLSLQVTSNRANAFEKNCSSTTLANSLRSSPRWRTAKIERVSPDRITSICKISDSSKPLNICTKVQELRPVKTEFAAAEKGEKEVNAVLCFAALCCAVLCCAVLCCALVYFERLCFISISFRHILLYCTLYIFYLALLVYLLLCFTMFFSPIFSYRLFVLFRAASNMGKSRNHLKQFTTTPHVSSTTQERYFLRPNPVFKLGFLCLRGGALQPEKSRQRMEENQLEFPRRGPHPVSERHGTYPHDKRSATGLYESIPCEQSHPGSVWKRE